MNELKNYLWLMAVIVGCGFLLSVTTQLTTGLFYKPKYKIVHYVCVERENSDFECRDAIDEDLIEEATERVRKQLNVGGK